MAYTIEENCIGCTACSLICPAGAVSGEKKSQHAIDPDICIECGACGRVCPTESVSDHFGLTIAKIPQKNWDRPRFDLSRCISCGICQDSCPAGVISQSLQQGGRHLLPFLADEKSCIACGFCALDCPVDAVVMVPRSENNMEAAA